MSQQIGLCYRKMNFVLSYSHVNCFSIMLVEISSHLLNNRLLYNNTLNEFTMVVNQCTVGLSLLWLLSQRDN